ncbi:8055_t:CDS:2 [Scutellospora calospora]|uniref:8055_t:CDS:1 n=1 Tax=Scutellospora calospora TaxID=85575 RepID=A0ACA9LFZ5_9GLOM|nr:8055_t:CDS:2 [Scutellospora calospora]
MSDNEGNYTYELSEEPTPLNLFENYTSFKLSEEFTSFEFSEEPTSSLNSSFLDSHLKTLSSWNEKTQEEAKAELTYQFELLIATNLEQIMASIFEISKNNELEYYLDPI